MLSDSNFKLYNSIDNLFSAGLQLIQLFFRFTENGIKFGYFCAHKYNLNPLKHKFTEDFRKYKHSSYRSYSSNSMTKLDREFILSLFDGLENFEYCHLSRQSEVVMEFEMYEQ